MAGEGGGGGFFTLIASTTPYGSYIQPHTRLVICSTACPCFVVMLIGACDPIRSDFMADCRLQAAVAGHAASRTHSTPVRPSTSTLFRTTSHVLLTLYTTHHVLWDRFSFSHMSQRHAAPRRPTPFVWRALLGAHAYVRAGFGLADCNSVSHLYTTPIHAMCRIGLYLLPRRRGEADCMHVI